MNRRTFVKGSLAAALSSAVPAHPGGADTVAPLGFDPAQYDPVRLDPPQFGLFWNFSKPRTLWEAVSYIRLFFRPAFQGLYGYFQNRAAVGEEAETEDFRLRLRRFLFPETYGICLFRGQMERAARALAKFTPEEARSLGPRRFEESLGPKPEKNRLVQAGRRRGLPEALAAELPYLLYVNAEPDLLGRCLDVLASLKTTDVEQSPPRLSDWRLDPQKDSLCFAGWFELVIRRYLRGHWSPEPSVAAVLSPSPAPEDCRDSFPDFPAAEVEAIIQAAGDYYAQYPDQPTHLGIEILRVPKVLAP